MTERGPDAPGGDREDERTSSWLAAPSEGEGANVNVDDIMKKDEQRDTTRQRYWHW
jgi:hypothetical protein